MDTTNAMQTTLTPRRCYLLELPAELRLQIYELHYPESARYAYVTSTGIYGNRYYENFTAILRAAKLLHREALPVLMARMTVYFHMKAQTVQFLQKLNLDTYGPKLQHIEIDCCCWRNAPDAMVDHLEHLLIVLNRCSAAKSVTLHFFEKCFEMYPLDRPTMILGRHIRDLGTILNTLQCGDGAAWVLVHHRIRSRDQCQFVKEHGLAPEKMSL